MLDLLTRAENRVLPLIAQGFSNKELALKIDCSESTIKAHVKAIIKKLHVENRTQVAMTYWRMFGFPGVAPVAFSVASLPDDIRACGWAVAIHNDYALKGMPATFWLFTTSDRAVKGEGSTDAEALNIVRAQLGMPAHEQAADGQGVQIIGGSQGSASGVGMPSGGPG